MERGRGREAAVRELGGMCNGRARARARGKTKWCGSAASTFPLRKNPPLHRCAAAIRLPASIHRATPTAPAFFLSDARPPRRRKRERCEKRDGKRKVTVFLCFSAVSLASCSPPALALAPSRAPSLGRPCAVPPACGPLSSLPRSPPAPALTLPATAFGAALVPLLSRARSLSARRLRAASPLPAAERAAGTACPGSARRPIGAHKDEGINA